ncbi:MAG: hypothetical protein UHM16_03075 [Acutalibacteraceae bacterium]|nr:hypothetical protein [Acutalibacteraceae bacterium]
MKENKRNKTKIVIIILSVLLALSVIALAGTLIYKKTLKPATEVTVTVPDNLITPESEKENESKGEISQSHEKSQTKAITISLNNKTQSENKPFSVNNMLPGDSKTEYFRVNVSYHGKVTVNYSADVRNGYEKLGEVLKIKVTLLGQNQVLYDGAINSMPEKISHPLSSKEHTEEELYYEIKTYLDTSVSNEYMDMALIADFKWDVGETQNLDAPQTGDLSDFALPLVCLLSALFLLILLLSKRKKEREYE